jgi:hypothetical protein
VVVFAKHEALSSLFSTGGEKRQLQKKDKVLRLVSTFFLGINPGKTEKEHLIQSCGIRKDLLEQAKLET